MNPTKTEVKSGAPEV